MQSMKIFPFWMSIKPIILLVCVTHNCDLNIGLVDPGLQMSPGNYNIWRTQWKYSGVTSYAHLIYMSSTVHAPPP
jgi:hypothetical protein